MADASAVPPGTYAGGQRSPVVHVWLCPSCGGYVPLTKPGYSGTLTGHCQGCGGWSAETHRFAAFIDSASGCTCTTAHERRTGDLSAAGSEGSDRG